MRRLHHKEGVVGEKATECDWHPVQDEHEFKEKDDDAAVMFQASSLFGEMVD